MSAPAVGIDLGTTNSVVAVSIGGRPQVVRDASGASLIPSMVSFGPGGERLVGRPARVRRPLDPANTIYSVKRLLGRPFKSEEVRRARSRVAFELKEGPDSSVLVVTRGGELSLPEVSAIVLQEVRRIAEEGLGEKIGRCVITVPANFNELQRSSTKIAGRIADLEVIRILNEPTAAALAYGYGRGTREKICIFDFGGGTFDVTLLELSGNVFEVLATAGDTFLGGDDLDIALADSLVAPFQRATRLDASDDRIVYDVLRDAAEQAKIELSTSEVARVMVAQDLPHNRKRMEFQHTLTRQDLERIAAPFISRTFDVCTEALKLANLRTSDLTAVILVGGSTRIPAVRQRVASFFGREPLTHLAPEEVVGLGAAILAEALTGGARRQHTQRLIPNRPNQPPSGPPEALSPSVAPPPVAPVPAPPSAPPPLPTAGTGTFQGVQSGARPGPADDRFDLDEPFAPPTLGATQPQRPSSREVPAKPRQSDLMWEPRKDQGAASLGSLDEPSFMGRMPDSSRAPSSPGFEPPVVAPLPVMTRGSSPAINPAGGSAGGPPRRASAPSLSSSGGSRPNPRQDEPPLDPFEDRTISTMPYSASASVKEASVPSFNLDDPSLMVPNPALQPPGSGPSVAAVAAGMFGEPRASAVPSFNLDDPSIMAPVPGGVPPAEAGRREASSPGFGFSDPGAPVGETKDVSIPSFHIDPDEIFGSPAPPPSRAPGGSGASRLPAGPPPSVGPASSVERTVALDAPPPPVERTVAMPSFQPPTTSPFQPPPGMPPVPPPFPGGAGATARPAQPPMPPPVPPVMPPPPSAPPPVPPLAAQAAVMPPPVMQPPTLPPAPVRPPAPPSAPVASGPSTGGSRSGPAPRPPTMAPPRGAAPLLLDVTPFSLGVETAGGLCETVIRRNATIPVEQTRVFATTYDMQESVLIRIAQGESRRFGDNQHLGELELSGLRAANRGEVTIGVTFELEADGTLRVSAKDLETGREQKIRVTLLTLPSEAQQAEMAARMKAASAAHG